jgi:PAS domain S-box-containing protein
MFVFVTISVWFVFDLVRNVLSNEVPKQTRYLEMEINIKEASESIYLYDSLSSSVAIDQWEENISNYQEGRDLLLEYELTDEEHRIVNRLDEVKREIVNVGQRIIEINQQIGLDNNGLIGKFRNDIHFVEDVVVDRVDLHDMWLQIRRHEKDFLLHQDKIYVDQVEESVVRLRQSLQNEEARERLDSYLQYFLSAADLTLTRIELQREYRGLIAQIDDILDDELQNISTSEVDRQSQWATYSFLAIVLVLVLSVLIIYQAIRSIIDRIDYYRQVTTDITEGDIDKRIVVSENDELSRLAEDFNEMTDNILSEQIFTETLFESIGDGAIVIDSTMKIKLFNPAAERITGFSEDEVIGEGFDEVIKLVHDETGHRNDSFIRKALLDGEVQYMDGTTSLVRNDGEKIAVDDSAAPIFDSNGNIKGVVIIFRDVTEQRKLEENKEMFFNIASHQLRTPLGSMRWNLEALLAGDEGEIPEKMQPILEDVKNSNERLVKLVNDLLDISRIEQGRQIDEKEVVDIKEVIDEVEHQMLPIAEEKNVELQMIIDDSIPQLQLYRREIRDVVENLLSNAIKYSGGEGGKVTLEAMFSGNNLKIQVSDTGIGIPKSDQDQIFSRFYRASNATTLNVQGTGIGLSVSKMFVEKMGGKMWFESEEEEGTVFHVVIPYNEVAVQDDA